MNRLDDFLAKVSPEPNSGCWLWTAAAIKGGYARFGNMYAHRFSYEHYRGPIPEGLQIDHLCRVRCCVNPQHLEAVTQQENIKRGMAGKYPRSNFCPLGHPLSGTNLYVSPKRGHRDCKQCRRARVVAYRLRKKAACTLSDR